MYRTPRSAKRNATERENGSLLCIRSTFLICSKYENFMTISQANLSLLRWSLSLAHIHFTPYKTTMGEEIASNQKAKESIQMALIYARTHTQIQHSDNYIYIFALFVRQDILVELHRSARMSMMNCALF